MTRDRSISDSASPGLWIAIFGPDGVGKSAVIEQLKAHLEGEFESITRFHFRPEFRRSGQDGPPVTRPHARNPRGRWLSLIKLIYWLADCWYGYLIAIAPRRRRSGLVIFDRYYPDILVDPLRYRLPASCARVAVAFAGLAPRPDLYVLLDANPETVAQRKSELSLSELRGQRAAYLRMLQCWPCKLIVNAECPLNEVTQNITAAIASFHKNSVSAEPSRLASFSIDRTNL